MNAHIFLRAVACAALCGCVSQKVAVERPRTAPLVVQIAEIDRENQEFRPMQLDNRGVLLPIQFKRGSEQTVDSLWPTHTPSPTEVWIFQGRSLIARAWVAGPSEARDASGEPRHGVVLRFPSLADAMVAADHLQEDPWEALDRHLADSRFWILPGSGTSGAAVSRSQPPPSGLPRELPKIQSAR